MGHLGESQGRNAGRFPQPGEPFGLALNLSQVPSSSVPRPPPPGSPWTPTPCPLLASPPHSAVEVAPTVLWQPQPLQQLLLATLAQEGLQEWDLEEEGGEYLMASGKGTKIYKRLQSGAGEGQRAADTITSSQVPLRGTQPLREVDLAKYPQASSSTLGRSRFPVSSFFCPASS